MSNKAGKTGTRKGRPRGSRGTGGGRLWGHVAAFITGVATANGAGAGISEAAREMEKQLHPAVDGVLSTVGGAVPTALSAAARPLRPFAVTGFVGNVVGGILRGGVLWMKNRTAAPGTGASVAEQLRRKRLANGSGASAAETMRSNRMTAMQRRFAVTAN